MAVAKGAGEATWAGADTDGAKVAADEGAKAGPEGASATGVSAAAAKHKPAMTQGTMLTGVNQCFRTNNTSADLRWLTLLGLQELKKTRVCIGVGGQVIDQQGGVDLCYFQRAVFRLDALDNHQADNQGDQGQQ